MRARTDVYSLGTILYELLVGEMPYSAPNVYGVMRAKTSIDPQPPSRFDPHIDPHLEELVLHAIERRPGDRYASAAAMLEDLEHPENVHVTGRAHRLHPQNLRSQKFRRAAGVVLFFVSLFGFFFLLIWLANRYPAAPPKPGMPNRGEVR